MDVDVNMWGVFWAAVSSMVIGSIWYARGVFGASWMKMAGIDEKKMRENMDWTPMVAMFVLSLVMAYVLAHVSYLSFSFFEGTYMNAAITSGFWLWLGLVVPTMLGTGLFSQTRKKLMAINLGNWLVTLVVMGWVLGLVGL